MCLLEVLCFLEVDMNYLQTRLCEFKKRSLRLVEMTGIQATLLKSPLFPRLVEDGDPRCHLFWHPL